jgi:cell wall-associated NlpC family hydrolase
MFQFLKELWKVCRVRASLWPAAKVTVEVPLPMKMKSKIDWDKFVRLGKDLVGKQYKFGVEVDLADGDPSHIKALDCSELIEWLFAQIGIPVSDGSYNQFHETDSVGKDEVQIGDLCFKWNATNFQVHHVGVYIGEDTVLEAKGHAWGVILTPKKAFESSTEFARWGRLKLVKTMA